MGDSGSCGPPMVESASRSCRQPHQMARLRQGRQQGERWDTKFQDLPRSFDWHLRIACGHRGKQFGTSLSRHCAHTKSSARNGMQCAAFLCFTGAYDEDYASVFKLSESRPVWDKEAVENKSKAAILIGHTGSFNYRSTQVLVSCCLLPTCGVVIALWTSITFRQGTEYHCNECNYND